SDKLAIVDAAGAWPDLLGYGVDEILHFKLARIIPHSAIPDVVALFERLKVAELPEFEAPCIKSDGALRETHWSVRWSEANSQFDCTIHDNTERKRAENLRRETLAIVTEDLKEPLSKANSVLYQLSREHQAELSEKAQGLLKKATTSASHMLTLVDD